MATKKTKERILPPGFSDADFKEIKIKSVKKDKKGYLIELKSSMSKEKDTKYTYTDLGAKYQILKDGHPVLTPGKNIVLTSSETIVKKVVDFMNMNGEQYEDATSIVSFLYSEIDFFKDRDRVSLAADILNDLHQIDWTLRNPYYGSKNSAIWDNKFGTSKERMEEVINWIATLNKHQTEGVYIMTGNISSPNIAFILSNKISNKELPSFTKFCEEKYTLHQKKEGQGMYYFWPYEQMLKIFNNYLFWQKVNI